VRSQAQRKPRQQQALQLLIDRESETYFPPSDFFTQGDQ